MYVNLATIPERMLGIVVVCGVSSDFYHHIKERSKTYSTNGIPVPFDQHASSHKKWSEIANLFYATVRSDILGGDYDHIKNEEERKKYVHFLTLMESNAIGKTIVDLSKE